MVHLVAELGIACAVRELGAVRCWGSGTFGILGTGNTDDVLDPSDLRHDLDADGMSSRITHVAPNGLHNCVVLEGGRLRCWGMGMGGALGTGS